MTNPNDTSSPSSPSSLVLAIETATLIARVAVVDGDGAVVAEAQAEAARHSSNLLRLCVEVTERAGVAVGALRAIACGAGPGSFTGLRVGMAVAKGLAMPTETPFVLVSSLDALARDMAPHAAPGTILLPCLDAGKGQVFSAAYQRGEDGGAEAPALRRTADLAAAPEALPTATFGDGPVLIAGPGAARYREILLGSLGARARFADVAGPTAESVARLALVRLARGETDDLASSVPSYGRAPDITRPKRPPGTPG